MDHSFDHTTSEKLLTRVKIFCFSILQLDRNTTRTAKTRLLCDCTAMASTQSPPQTTPSASPRSLIFHVVTFPWNKQVKKGCSGIDVFYLGVIGRLHVMVKKEYMCGVTEHRETSTSFPNPSSQIRWEFCGNPNINNGDALLKLANRSNTRECSIAVDYGNVM